MRQFDLSVNGLRALAILIVIAFHYGIPPFYGGFVGVDIFFVISGYVITLSIFEKLKAKKFSLKGYFKSRFFRIFPALLVISFFTLAISSIVMFPADAKRSASHALGSISFISNFLYWKEVGYFNADSEYKPFLHTWSLAVEWQFYMFWPVFVLYKQAVFRELLFSDIIIMIALTLTLSHLSYRYIEQPFRKPSEKLQKFRALILILITGLCFAMAGYVLHTDGKTGRYGAQENALINYFQNANDTYREKYGVFFPQSNDKIWAEDKHTGIPCLYDGYYLKSSKDPRITQCIVNNIKAQKDKSAHYVIIGDSNGKNTFEALTKAFPNHSFSMLMHSGCAAAESKNCFPHIVTQLNNIINAAKPNGIILSSRYSDQPIEGMDKTLAFLNESSIPFLIIGATPTLRRTPDMVMLRKGITLDSMEFILPLENAYYHPDIFYKDTILEGLANQYGGIFFDKKKVLCPENICILKSEHYKTPLYLDSNHLSEDGIDLLATALRSNQLVYSFFSNDP